jgi:hypothetical protein
MRDKTTKVKQRAICGRDELLLVPNSKAAPQRGPTNISKTNFVEFGCALSEITFDRTPVL